MLLKCKGPNARQSLTPVSFEVAIEEEEAALQQVKEFPKQEMQFFFCTVRQFPCRTKLKNGLNNFL